jgi:hypothetical protein
VVWRRRGGSTVELRDRLLKHLGPQLLALGASRVQCNVADLTEHETGLPMYGRTRPLPDGIISFWLSSAYRRAPAEAVLTDNGRQRVAGYLVSEATILRNMEHPARPGQRTRGFSQVALLHQASSMDFPSWRRHWVDVHTKIAIDTQASFRYVQNFVVEALTLDAPPWRGIVEEGFPLAAIRDERVFFDAVGDEAKLQANQLAMMNSVRRFLDPDGCDLIRTSEYLLSDAPEPVL